MLRRLDRIARIRSCRLVFLTRGAPDFPRSISNPMADF